MKDEILQELWKVKDEIAREHNYNVRKLIHALKDKQRHASVKVVNLSKDIKKAS